MPAFCSRQYGGNRQFEFFVVDKDNAKLRSQIAANTQEGISRGRNRKYWDEQPEVRNQLRRVLDKLFSSPLMSSEIENDEV